MKSLKFSISRFALILIAAFIAATAAHAQSTAQRTFVSTTGNDGNTSFLCSNTNPCRSFNVALTVTTAGGEIVPLTSGGYGATNISKSVKIVVPGGVYAAITQSGGGSAITVNAGSNDLVVLKGLTLNGINNAGVGVDFNTGAALVIENCTISGFNGVNGADASIKFDAAGQLFVRDTTVRNGRTGILVAPSAGGTANVSIDRCRFEQLSQYGVYAEYSAQVSVHNSSSVGNGDGFIAASGGARLTVNDSTAANNTGSGFTAIRGGEVNVERCIARGNGIAGMNVTDANSRLRVSNSMVVNNSVGFKQSDSGTLETRGNNTVDGNTTDISNGGTPLTTFGGN